MRCEVWVDLPGRFRAVAVEQVVEEVLPRDFGYCKVFCDPVGRVRSGELAKRGGSPKAGVAGERCAAGLVSYN